MVGEIRFSITAHSDAQPEDIMMAIRDWQRLPEFWHGMRSIRRGSGQMLEVTFAFPGRAKMSYLCDWKSQNCVENYHSGPFSGYKRIELQRSGSGTNITVRWEIKLSLRMLLLKRFLEGHFRQGTNSAIERICSEAARMSLQAEAVTRH